MVEILGKEEGDPLKSSSMHSVHLNSVEALEFFTLSQKWQLKMIQFWRRFVYANQVWQLHLFVPFSGKRPRAFLSFPLDDS